jgi:Zn-dependent protease/predicted transcriptional regulator
MGMRWSWRIGRLFGIDVRVHATFAILIAFVAIGHIVAGHDARTTLADVFFILIIFAIVVMHEFGHALVARRYGCNTKDITLLPIGGVARLEKIPQRPRHELLVAIAGPMVNVVFAIACAIVAIATRRSLATADVVEGSFVARLFWVNVTLAIFNMLPAFPMDGGRALRALLAMRLPHPRATRIAAQIGRALAVVLGIVGLFVNPILAFIAVFIWIGATQERALADVEGVLSKERAADAMFTEMHPLPPQTTVVVAAEQMLRGAYKEVPVLVDGQVVGVVTRNRLFEALGNTPDAPIMSLVEPVAHVGPNDSLHTVAKRLAEGEMKAAVVEENGAVRGLITPENIAAFAAMRRALIVH